MVITYSAGIGNDVGLFTAAAEPSSAAVLGLLFGGAMLGRRRNVRAEVVPIRGCSVAKIIIAAPRLDPRFLSSSQDLPQKRRPECVIVSYD